MTDRHGNKQEIYLEAATVAEGGTKLIRELASAGYLLPRKDHHTPLADAIAAARPTRTKHGVTAPGWWEGTYIIKSGEQIRPAERQQVILSCFRGLR